MTVFPCKCDISFASLKRMIICSKGVPQTGVLKYDYWPLCKITPSNARVLFCDTRSYLFLPDKRDLIITGSHAAGAPGLELRAPKNSSYGFYETLRWSFLTSKRNKKYFLFITVHCTQCSLLEICSCNAPYTVPWTVPFCFLFCNYVLLRGAQKWNLSPGGQKKKKWHVCPGLCMMSIGLYWQRSCLIFSTWNMRVPCIW